MHIKELILAGADSVARDAVQHRVYEAHPRHAALHVATLGTETLSAAPAVMLRRVRNKHSMTSK